MVKDGYRIAYIKDSLPDSPDELLKLKTKSGKVFITQEGVKIQGDKEDFEFNYNEAVSVSYKRRQMFGFVIFKSKKYTVNMIIPRINIKNWFLITNFFATISVYRHLKNKFKKK